MCVKSQTVRLRRSWTSKPCEHCLGNRNAPYMHEYLSTECLSRASLADGQVAEALASRGAVRASVSLLAALAQDALLEGWLSLAAGLLFRLLEVSRPLVAVRLRPTAPYRPSHLRRFCPCPNLIL